MSTTVGTGANLLTDERVAALRAALRGELIASDHAAYDHARRVWNGNIDRRPALIARCTGVADVQAAVNFARTHGLVLSVRDGGHSAPGYGTNDGGLVIDLSGMKGIRVDPSSRTVRAEGGVIWRELDHETQAFGLATTGGTVSNTGIVGLTLGGGLGWLMGKCGLAVDNVISADVVTAGGHFHQTSAQQNPDLFWALRGGGGNFGAVTSFEFRAHRHGPRTLCGMVVHPMAQARLVMEQYRQITAVAPDELCCLLMLRHAPAAPYLPRDVHGKPIAAIAVCWTGDPAGGGDAVLPLKAFGRPLADTIAPKPFVEHQTMLDAGQPFGRRYYWKSDYFAEIGDGLVDAMVEHGERITSPHSSVLLMHLGGAPARIDPTSNAVGLRSASYVLNIQAAWESPQEDDRHLAWAREYWTATRPFSTGSAYINFMTEDEGEARVRAAFGHQIYARLRDIKSKFDPGNLFHGAQNIPPR
jgi:hypothetical protein